MNVNEGNEVKFKSLMPGHQTNLTANLYKTPKQYFTHKCKEFNLNHKVKQSINFNSGGTRESTAVVVLLLIMCDGKNVPPHFPSTGETERCI